MYSPISHDLNVSIYTISKNTDNHNICYDFVAIRLLIGIRIIYTIIAYMEGKVATARFGPKRVMSSRATDIIIIENKDTKTPAGTIIF